MGRTEFKGIKNKEGLDVLQNKNHKLNQALLNVIPDFNDYWCLQ